MAGPQPHAAQPDPGVFQFGPAGAGVPIELSQAGRQVWLVKIPPTLSAAWRDALYGGSGGAVGAAALGNNTAPFLGRIRVEDNPEFSTFQQQQRAMKPNMPARNPPKAPKAKVMKIVAEVPIQADYEKKQQAGPVQQQQQQQHQTTRQETFQVEFDPPREPMLVLEERDLEPLLVRKKTIKPEDRERYGESAFAGEQQQQQQQQQEEEEEEMVVPIRKGPETDKFSLAAVGHVQYNCVAKAERRSVAYLPQSLLAAKARPSVSMVDASEVDLAHLKRFSTGQQQQQRSIEPDRIRRRPGKEAVARMERSELEQELFRLFEEAPRWTVRELQQQTRQPDQFLRQVLSDIAFQNKAGPHRLTWELQPQYRTGSSTTTGV